VFILLLLACLAVIAGIALVAAGFGASMPEPAPDRAPYGVLPAGQDVDGEDVERLRFSLAFRGYRMDEVDDVLDRLTAEIAARDARIAELEGHPGDPGLEGPAVMAPESTDSGPEGSHERTLGG
jgi:DivIVA domain-containing protein